MVWPLFGRIELKPENNNFFGLYALRNAAKVEAHLIPRVTPPQNMTLLGFLRITIKGIKLRVQQHNTPRSLYILELCNFQNVYLSSVLVHCKHVRTLYVSGSATPSHAHTVV